MKARVIAIGIVLVCLCGWCLYQNAYQKGYKAATDKIQKQITEQQQKQQQTAQQAGISYQNHKTQREEKAKVQYVEIPKIIEKPTYRDNCIDDAGWLLINQAVGNK